MKIAINAGHCPGLDSGACGDFLQEAEVVKEVASIVCDDLQKVGYEVLFIQENELYDITDISNNWGADLFVSIHCNAANGSARGTECFYYSGSNKGYKLADCIQKQLIDTINRTADFDAVDRGLKDNRLYVTTHTDCTACLVELEFIDNPEREQYISDHMPDLAHAVARGITDYMI